MRKTQLSSSEIQDLVNRYKSELKKLDFQVEEINLTISELEQLLFDVNGRERTAIMNTKPKPRLVKDDGKKRKKEKSDIAAPAKPRKQKAIANIVAGGGKIKKAKGVKSAKIAKPTLEIPSQEKPNAKGYKLSGWDELVIEGVSKSDKAQITQEIIDYVGSNLKSKSISANAEEVKNRVIRSLQKLVNRRGDLAKVPYKGKGFAYALPSWTDAKGKINKEFKR